MELGDSNGKIRGRVVGPKGDRNSTGIPTGSTNLDPWDSQCEPAMKKHTQAGPTLPHTYVADVQLEQYVGPEQPWAIPKTVACT